MNIGVDARPLSYQLTGIGYYLQWILEELQKIDRENHYFLISNAPINFNLKRKNWFKIEGGFTKKHQSSIWYQAVVPYLCYSHKIDLFWGTRHHLPILLPFHTKAVLTIHDIVHKIHPETMAVSGLILERLLMQLSIARSQQIITVSESTAKDLNKYYKIKPKKIDIIYPGIPLSFREYENKANANVDIDGGLPSNYFLFVGTLEPRKNLLRLVKAFQLLDQAKYDIHLIIVGPKGWRDETLKKMINEVYQNRIHRTGYVSRKILNNLYENALALLMPSLYEGFGFPILEAMAKGTPVITSNTSSMSEISRDAAVCVNPYQIEEIKNAMIQIIEDEKFRNDLIEKGYARVNNFSWYKSAHKTLNTFNGIA